MARRSKLDVFGLSFLDAMTCGFGAVILFFMVIQGATDAPPEAPSFVDRRGEVDRLEEEVLVGHEHLVELRNAVAAADEEARRTHGLSRRLIETLQEIQAEVATFEKSTLAKEEHVRRLQSDLKTLEQDTKRLSASLPSDETPGDNVRSFVGDGDRQYLTGLKVGGERILILVDASASMLADTVVNVVVRRNLPASKRRQADKWRRAVATADWLTTQMPATSYFQLYTFDESASPVVPGTAGTWLEAGDPKVVDDAVGRLRRVAPYGGTNLLRAFEVVRRLRPRPDNVILLVDGLPTQGRKPPRQGTIDGDQRLRLFEEAVSELAPGGALPINVVLFPMEGDPRAASAYWQLAMASRGSFLAPAEDWP